MDIKKAIEKLNSIDAKNLRNIDISRLKEFNIDYLKDALFTKPTIIINTILSITTIVIIIHSFSNFSKQAKIIKSTKIEVEQKLDILNKNKLIQEEYNKFLASFPKTIPDNQLIGKISEFAEKTNIYIVTFSPLETKKLDSFDEDIVNLSIRADTYQDIINFISIIENSPYSLKVNNWSVHSYETNQANKDNNGEVLLNVFVEISSIQLNDA